MLARTALKLLVPLMVTGCTGFSLGENVPGSDTWLELGEIAVDERTEKSFLLNNIYDDSGVESRLLRGIDPDTGAVSDVADLAGRYDARILFPASGILVMSEENGKDELLLVDKDTFEEKAREQVNVRYHGTRMSPSRDWVAVADNTSDKSPIHIIDAHILEQRILPHDGDWLEAMWKNQTDELFAIVFYDDLDQDPQTNPRTRLLSWSMEDVVAGKFEPGEDGFWPDRKLDIDFQNMAGDLDFSFTWIGVSPDDKWAVFPVRETDPATPETHALLVLETATGDVRMVKNAKGPVGFTPDSSTIISYDDKGSQNGPGGTTPDGDVDQRLLLIDVNTLEVDPQDVDISGGITYFISRDGNYVVVAGSYSDAKLVLYDIDNDKATQMAGPASGLDEFVSRKGKNELWVVDQQDLLKIDMNAAEVTGIPTGYPVGHLNILPKHDWLVLSEPPVTTDEKTETAPRVHFFDLETQETLKTIDIQ